MSTADGETPHPDLAPREADWPWVPVILGWLGLIWLLSLLGAPYGVDPYFHLQVADVMRERGIGFDTFPYATESIWAHRYFDKEWLFHVFLVPFLGSGKLNAGHSAVLVMNALLILGLWYTFKTLEIRKAWFWAALLPCSVFGMAWLRLTLLRPHLLAAPIFLVAIAAALRRKHILLGIMAFLYAMCHTAHWQLPFMIAAIDGVAILWPRKPEKRFRQLPLVVASVVGIAIATLLHPHFPNNLSGLYAQNVLVLKAYWQASATLAAVKPAELRPLGGALIAVSIPLLFCLLAVTVRAVRGKLRWHQDLSVLTIYALGYAVMTIKSARFLDYYAPCAVLFLACWFRQHAWAEHVELRWQRCLLAAALSAYFAIIGFIPVAALLVAIFAACELCNWEQARHRALIVGFALAVGAFTLGGLRGFVEERAAADSVTAPYAEAGALLSQHLAPGDIVFTANWSEPPWLWFHAPEQRFMMFLEPMFFYLQSRERFELWHQTRLGQSPDPVSVIRDTFSARAAVLYQARSAPLVEQLRASPDVQELDHFGPHCERIFLFPPPAQP